MASTHQAFIDHVDGKLGLDQLFRELLAHPTWFVGGHRNRTFAWMASREVTAHELQLREEFIGTIEPVERIADWVAQLDQVSLLKVDPQGPISQAITGANLDRFRQVARVVQLEHDVKARDLSRVRIGTYYVVLVDDHLVGVSSERGDLIASFTSVAAATAFIRERAPDKSVETKLVRVSGDTLFGEVASTASGVIIDVLAPHFMKFDRTGCANMLAMIS
ncbi:MAG: hypothetical protein QM831_46105 [Kofleriaceae bacterium]